MLTVDAAFDRIGSALRQRSYAFVKEEKPPDSPGDRVSYFQSPNMSVKVSWIERAHLMTLHVQVEGEWVEFSRRGFGPNGLEDTAVEALVRAVFNEVAETSTDAG